MHVIRATYLPREDMYFDRQYYVANHMRLAREQLRNRVAYLWMQAEFDVRALMGNPEAHSPCVFALFVATEADVDAFRNFLSGPHVIPLREDVEFYTNCSLQWTVAEVVDG